MWKGTSSSSPPASPQATQATSPVSLPSYRLKNQGKRIAQIVKLKPDRVEEYKACHAKVWPEVLKQIKDCNIEDCKYSLLFSSCLEIPLYWSIAAKLFTALSGTPG